MTIPKVGGEILERTESKKRHRERNSRPPSPSKKEGNNSLHNTLPFLAARTMMVIKARNGGREEGSGSN